MGDIGVIVLGLGNVGQALVTLVQRGRQLHLQKYGVTFKFLALCDSQGSFSNQGAALTDAELAAALEWKKDRKPLSEFKGGSTSSASEMVGKFAGPMTMVIDCSATEATVEALIVALQQGAGVTLANKKPLTANWASWVLMTAPEHVGRLRYESTCGAGTPMIACLTRIINSGDSVIKVQGAMSGTLGYLMSGLEDGRLYSEVVNTAFTLGYTEPDPRDDLGGVDVARKTLICARTMGYQLEMTDVPIQPLYSEAMGKLPVSDFMKALPTLDKEYSAMVQDASSKQQVLRYVGTVEGGRCKVGLQSVLKTSPLGQLQGSENMMEFHTKMYGDKPMVLKGAGAGGEITAAGLVGDMLELVSEVRKA